MYHIIVNPASRSGKGYQLWKNEIEPALLSSNTKYRVYFSKEAGDIAAITASLLEKAEKNSDFDEIVNLLLLGGDGTVNECLQGIMPSAVSQRVRLGYIPTGSSNDLARDLHLPKSPQKVLQHILQSSGTHPADVGLVTFPDGSKRYFAVSCGIGYDAAICEESSRSPIKSALNKIKLGKLTYVGIALKQLLFTKSVSGKIIIDDKTVHFPKGILFASSMIHTFEGGGFKFCPQASFQDGLLDLCLIETMNKFKIIMALPLALKGRHTIFHGVNLYRGKSISIETDKPLWVHTDGEVTNKSSKIVVTCLHRAIHFIY